MPGLTSALRRVFLWMALAVVYTGAGHAVAEPKVVQVAAASDLRFVLPDLARDFQQRTGIETRVSFGSSGNFTRKIMAGAPFDVFLSADEAYIDKLAAAGLTEGRGALYATGRIVLFAPHGSPLDLSQGWEGALKKGLAEKSLSRFAIANPEHAPYGRASAQALGNIGLFEAMRPNLILGESAAQAAQFAASGSSVGGIVPLSIALSDPFREKGGFQIIPESLHQPLRQRMVVLKGATAAAQLFYDDLMTPKSRAALEHFGFSTLDGN